MSAPHGIAETLLEVSPADHTEVIVTATASVNTRWARNQPTTNGDARSTEVTLIAIADTGGGSRVASLTRPATGLEPELFARQAWQQALASPPAWDARPLVPGDGRAPGDWDAAAATTSAAELEPVLRALGEEIAQDAAAGREHSGYLQLTRTSTWLATSAGVLRRHDQPAARLELTVKSHQRTRSTWQGWAGPDLGGADLHRLAERARRELSWQQREVAVEPGRRTAILSPSATADLMIDLLWGADVRAAAEGRSVFSGPSGGTRIGERLSQRPLRLFSDPALPGQECAPFLVTGESHDSASVFDNGMAIPATDWIYDGVLTALVGSRASAQAAGVPLAPAPGNLALDAGGGGSLDDLVARTGEGLLITCTWYNRMVDPRTHLITGLTRDGVYMVRGGEIAGRAGNFRFNDSPFTLLRRIVDAGSPTPALGREMADYFTRTTMPALVVDGFNFSSASEAV